MTKNSSSHVDQEDQAALGSLPALDPQSDQAISSPDSREVVDSVRPDPGPKPRYTPTGILLGVDLGDKPQASSVKPQAPEATSDKHQAPSSKHQA